MTYFLWFLGVVLGLVGLFVLICLPHNLRVRRVRRVYKSLPSGVVEQVLQLTEQAAARGPSVTFLRLTEEVPCEESVLFQSHVGGIPYAEAGDDWPQETPEGEPAKFMLQVRLDHAELGDPWRGRLAGNVMSETDDADMDAKFTQVEQERELVGMHERYDTEVVGWEETFK